MERLCVARRGQMCDPRRQWHREVAATRGVKRPSQVVARGAYPAIDARIRRAFTGAGRRRLHGARRRSGTHGDRCCNQGCRRPRAPDRQLRTGRHTTFTGFEGRFNTVLDARFSTHCRSGGATAISARYLLPLRPAPDTTFWCSPWEPFRRIRELRPSPTRWTRMSRDQRSRNTGRSTRYGRRSFMRMHHGFPVRRCRVIRAR